jgi:serine/threonine-protein kinase
LSFYVGVKQRTATGALVDSRDLALGTPAYLAPETVSRQPVDGRTDLYSLGAVALSLLTGRRVFTQQTADTVVAAHLHERPVAPSSIAHQPVPMVLDEVILKCLSKNPADRPATATAISERLVASGLAKRWTAERASAWW